MDRGRVRRSAAPRTTRAGIRARARGPGRRRRGRRHTARCILVSIHHAAGRHVDQDRVGDEPSRRLGRQATEKAALDRPLNSVVLVLARGHCGHRSPFPRRSVGLSARRRLSHVCMCVFQTTAGRPLAPSLNAGFAPSPAEAPSVRRQDLADEHRRANARAGHGNVAGFVTCCRLLARRFGAGLLAAPEDNPSLVMMISRSSKHAHTDMRERRLADSPTLRLGDGVR